MILASVFFGDIQWRTGEILVRGKGYRLDDVQLPPAISAKPFFAVPPEGSREK